MPKEDPFVNRAQLLKAIKRYPEIWDSNNKLHMCRSVTAPMWHEIAEQFGGHVSTVKLQSIWSQMKYHYHNLVHRQILHKERFTTKWEHFEPMSFMYNITVAKIVGAATSNVGLSETVTKLSTNATTTASATQMGVGIEVDSSTDTGAGGGGVGVIGIDVGVQLTQFSGFSGLVPPAAFTIETSTMTVRKPGRPGSFNNSMRGRIIDAIKARPILWAGRQKDYKLGQNRTSAVWKEVAADLGLTPSLIQTRWSIIKQRFVDELQKERHAFYGCEAFHSNWEHFERMAFMRDVLAKKVDEREQTREHIQEIVSEKQQQQQQQQEQQQMHQIVQQQQHLHCREPIRYLRASATSGANDGVAVGVSVNVTPSVFLSTSQTTQQQEQHDAHTAALTIYDENGGELVLSNAQSSTAMSGVLAGQVISSGSRRRIKNENDLEWDPFEMILHVPSGPVE